MEIPSALGPIQPEPSFLLPSPPPKRAEFEGGILSKSLWIVNYDLKCRLLQIWLLKRARGPALLEHVEKTILSIKKNGDLFAWKRISKASMRWFSLDAEIKGCGFFCVEIQTLYSTDMGINWKTDQSFWLSFSNQHLLRMFYFHARKKQNSLF